MAKFKINHELFSIKSHFFCFMAAVGPILPQLSVYGKELGISPVIMGSINGVLPVLFLFAKPIFGLIVDVYRDYRKTIFMTLIIVMSTSYALLYILPVRSLRTHLLEASCQQLDTCNVTDDSSECSTMINMNCMCKTANETTTVLLKFNPNEPNSTKCLVPTDENLCSHFNVCAMECLEEAEIKDGCLYRSWTFWYFVIFMSVGTIGFNVINSISDAICFDVIGEKHDYGKQRVWGTIGFGVTALLSGYIIDWISDDSTLYTPAFVIMLVFTFLDLLSCIKLKLPVMKVPENIFKDLRKLMGNRHTVVFILYSVFAGVVDSFIVYFLFWYLEDLAKATSTQSVKLLEGLIVAGATLVGEVIFFSISGKILERIGYAHSFSMCFLNYALRLGLLSVVPSPWWILPIELVMQGPTYALTYTTIVAYANAIAPPGASATMQGIAAGMDDGFGYSIGSLVGGILYKNYGGKVTLQIFSTFAVTCSISHLIIYKIFLQHRKMPNQKPVYKSPADAALSLYESSTATDDVHCI